MMNDMCHHCDAAVVFCGRNPTSYGLSSQDKANTFFTSPRVDSYDFKMDLVPIHAATLEPTCKVHGYKVFLHVMSVLAGLRLRLLY